MPGTAALVRMAALATVLGLFSSRVAAFELLQAPAAKPELTQTCPGLVALDAPRILPAALRVALDPEQVRITYIGHSSFLIESPQLVRIATDYNDYVRPPVVPDILTMNHAHSTHFTDHPDPAIKYVLPGWGPTPDQPARHDITVNRYEVRYIRSDGRAAEGVDVPFHITGNLAQEVIEESTATLNVEVVRRQAKFEPPLSQLVVGGGPIVTTMFAEITVWGRTTTGQTTNSNTARVQIDFADFGDVLTTCPITGG